MTDDLVPDVRAVRREHRRRSPHGSRARTASRRGAIRRIVLTAAAVLLLTQRIEAQPPAAQIFAEMHWSADDWSRVLNGEFVMQDVAPASPRDLTLRMAFLVRVPPDELCSRALSGDFVGTDPQVVSSHEFIGPGTLADLAALHISDDVARAFVTARPGAALNLSAGEIAAFNALRGAPTAAVEQRLRQMLLDRYRAYRAEGLRAIAPYDRGNHVSDVAEELRRADDAAAELKRHLPDLQQQLIAYPQPVAATLEQRFRWAYYNIAGAPTFVLMHEMAVPAGKARALVQRQYYVSTGYNAEQVIAGLLPVEGGALVVYTNHTFTDQLTGFGDALKRSIGRRMMSNQLKRIFDAARAQAATGRP